MFTAIRSRIHAMSSSSTTCGADEADDSMYGSAMTFEDLGLSQELLKGVYEEMRFERPSKIQATTLPLILRSPYRDLVAQAQNGSGKTTCFVLAMLSRIDPKLSQPQALCVCPTRELVVQNRQVSRRMSKYTGITHTDTAESSCRTRPVQEQLVLGTHGTLKRWMDLRILDASSIRIVVFDEADEMLKERGFHDDSVRMIRDVQRCRSEATQLVLFSATFSDEVRGFVRAVAPLANQVYVPKEELSLDVIAQHNVRCPRPKDKLRVLKELIFPNAENLGQTIIFVRSRDTCRSLHHALDSDGFKCTSVAGDRDKSERDRVVQEFRDGATKILIATDLLSRGLDVSQVTLVINHDVPTERGSGEPAYETYLHRIGRCGRFGRRGAAFNLITGAEDEKAMHRIAAYFQRPIPDIACDDEDMFIAALVSAGLRQPDDS